MYFGEALSPLGNPVTVTVEQNDANFVYIDLELNKILIPQGVTTNDDVG